MSFKILGRVKLDGDELGNTSDHSCAATGVGELFGKLCIQSDPDVIAYKEASFYHDEPFPQ